MKWLARGTQPVTDRAKIQTEAARRQSHTSLLETEGQSGASADITREDDCTFPDEQNGCDFPVSYLSYTTMLGLLLPRLLGEAWLCTQVV